MKITNKDGRAWISKYGSGIFLKGRNPRFYRRPENNEGLTIHITNAEVESAEVKGSMINIKVKK